MLPTILFSYKAFTQRQDHGQIDHFSSLSSMIILLISSASFPSALLSTAHVVADVIRARSTVAVLFNMLVAGSWLFVRLTLKKWLIILVFGIRLMTVQNYENNLIYANLWAIF